MNQNVIGQFPTLLQAELDLGDGSNYILISDIAINNQIINKFWHHMSPNTRQYGTHPFFYGIQTKELDNMTHFIDTFKPKTYSTFLKTIYLKLFVPSLYA